MLVKFDRVEGNLLLMFSFYLCFDTLPVFYLLCFFSYNFSLQYLFYIKYYVLFIFHRCSLYSYLPDRTNFLLDRAGIYT